VCIEIYSAWQMHTYTQHYALTNEATHKKFTSQHHMTNLQKFLGEAGEHFFWHKHWVAVMSRASRQSFENAADAPQLELLTTNEDMVRGLIKVCCNICCNSCPPPPRLVLTGCPTEKRALTSFPKMSIQKQLFKKKVFLFWNWPQVIFCLEFCLEFYFCLILSRVLFLSHSVSSSISVSFCLEFYFCLILSRVLFLSRAQHLEPRVSGCLNPLAPPPPHVSPGRCCGRAQLRKSRN